MAPPALHILLLLALFALALGTGASPEENLHGQNVTTVFDMFGVDGFDISSHAPLVLGPDGLDNSSYIPRANASSPHDTEDSHSTNNTNNDNSNGDGNEEDPYTDPRSALQHPRIKRRLTASPLFPDLHLGERIVAFYHWLRGWVRRVVELLLLPVERAYAWGGWYAAFVVSLLLVLPVLIVQE
ncbi:hypothetical protein HDK90DRAFT_512813 [Phyllosticta capitalensis]|uniref:Uncharacterized protein n=2 Tax=Phyllosticta capitalensis TaxID=121624 RepID=A0ABR1YIE3_9PEZI